MNVNSTTVTNMADGVLTLSERWRCINSLFMWISPFVTCDVVSVLRKFTYSFGPNFSPVTSNFQMLHSMIKHELNT